VIRHASSSMLIAFLPESPLLSWCYGSEAGKAGRTPSLQRADDLVHHPIHLVGGIARVHTVPSCHVTNQV
jgi:hypothetical protein